MTIGPIEPRTAPPGARLERPAPSAPPAPPVAEDAYTAAPEPAARPSVRVLAGMGLALAMAAALAGCGQPPQGSAPPAPPTSSQPAPVKEDPTGASVPLETRLVRLKKTDDRAYLRLVEANLYRRVLERVQPGEGADLARMHDIAARGLEQFRAQDDPAKSRDATMAAVQELAQGPTLSGRAGQQQALAASALKVGDAVARAYPVRDAGLMERLKTAGYETALEQLLRLPDEMASRGLGDAAQAREFLAAYGDLAQAALDAGRDIREPAVQAPLYEETLKQLYDRAQKDNSDLGYRVRQALDIALRLKDSLKGRLP